MTRKSVLITGCSTGIGRHLARTFAEEGHTVFATVRKDDDAASLRTANLQPLLMDVRDPQSVEAAAEAVKAYGVGLDALVNNAGVGGIGPLAVFRQDELDTLFGVNVFGVHSVTNAFLPQLLESQGRVINIGSQGGMTTAKYFGPYTMTKHALEAYTASLREELKPHRVWVCIVQPGGVVSAIAETSLAGDLNRFERAPAPFDREAKAMAETLRNTRQPNDHAEESEENRKPSSPAIVADAVRHALFSDTPQEAYLVGTRREGNRIVHALLDRLALVNDSPSLGYTKEELHDLLDKHLDSRSD